MARKNINNTTTNATDNKDKFAQVDAQLRAAVAASESTGEVENTTKEERHMAPLVDKDKGKIVAIREKNPALMEPVKQSGIFKHMARKKTWQKDPQTGKSKPVWVFDGLRDYPEDVVAPMPIHSPLKRFVDEGYLRYTRIAQVDQQGKTYKKQKYTAFKEFAEIAKAAGYLCIQPDWKDTELQIFYDTPERLAAFFGVTLEKLYASLGKLHKWLKLVKTPTKVRVITDTPIRVLYYEEPQNEYGRDVFDGDIAVKNELAVWQPSGLKQLWSGFCDFMQMRSAISINVLLKGLATFDEVQFLRRAVRVKEDLGISPRKYDMIINQHSVKFDNVGLEHGKIYVWPADQLFRFIGGRFKAGTSTLGAQLVAMADMQIARNILHEHGIMESAILIKSLAKGMPYAWIHIAKDYEKIDTNKFLELAFLVDRPKYGWRKSKMPSKHNQDLSFLESEYRKRISSLQVNTESAYVYTDPRCDEAMKKWHEKTGEWISFAIVPKGTKEDALNENGEVASIKYPLHSDPCIASHKALRQDIFDDKSPLVEGLQGGIGMSTIYQRTVKGLDADGDKVAKFKTAYHIPVELDLTTPPKEEKEPATPITDLDEAHDKTLQLSFGASKDTEAIGTIDLMIRYCFMWCHVHNVPITAHVSAMVGELREGGIKGGVKGDTKGIAGSATHLDVAASLEAGTLATDVLAWFGQLVGHKIDPLSEYGEINKDNLAEIIHFLVVKGAGCKDRAHSDKFLYRMQTLLPAYMAHKGDKKNNPWHDAMVLMSEGVKPEYLSAEKEDCGIFQKQYIACWKLVQASFKTYGAKELGYDFELDMVTAFADWLRDYYRRNSTGILNDYRGIYDRETGEVLRQGDFDVERKSRRYTKLIRIIRFLLNGINPHPADIEQIPFGHIPENVLARCMSFAAKDQNSNGYLRFAHIYTGTVEFNTRGKEGNSGGVAWYYPASVVYEARAIYYDKTTQGQKERRNPFLDITKDLATKFDDQWIERAKAWLERNPYALEVVHYEQDVDDDFEENEIADTVLSELDEYEYDSVD